jgi:hypothetical protein
MRENEFVKIRKWIWYCKYNTSDINSLKRLKLAIANYNKTYNTDIVENMIKSKSVYMNDMIALGLYNNHNDYDKKMKSFSIDCNSGCINGGAYLDKKIQAYKNCNYIVKVGYGWR